MLPAMNASGHDDLVRRLQAERTHESQQRALKSEAHAQEIRAKWDALAEQLGHLGPTIARKLVALGGPDATLLKLREPKRWPRSGEKESEVAGWRLCGYPVSSIGGHTNEPVVTTQTACLALLADGRFATDARSYGSVKWLTPESAEALATSEGAELAINALNTLAQDHGIKVE